MAGLGGSFPPQGLCTHNSLSLDCLLFSVFLVNSASLGSAQASLPQKVFLAPSLGWSLVLFL